MNMIPSGRESSSESDTQSSSLEHLFKHPEGLRTARDLVKAIVEHSQTQSSQLPSTEDSPTTHTSSDSSSGVAGILRDILEFSESGSQGLRFLVPNDNMNNQLPSTNVAPSIQHRTIATSSHQDQSLQQPIPSFHKNPMLNKQSLSTVALDKSAEREIRSILQSQNTSLSLGTESPYRVESPATKPPTMNPPHPRLQESGVTVAEMSGQDDRLQQQATSKFNVATLFDEDITRVYNPGMPTISHSSRFAHIEPKPTAIRKKLPDIAPKLPQVGKPIHALTARQPNTVKNFLPVNKSRGFHSDNAAKSATTRYDNTNNVNPLASRSNSPNLQPNPDRMPITSQTDFLSSLRSPSPETHSQTPEMAYEFSSNVNTDSETGGNSVKSNPAKGKRKQTGNDTSLPKRRKRGPKPKEKAPAVPKRLLKTKGKIVMNHVYEPGHEILPQDLMMRIFEFCPPAFFHKARTICRSWRTMVDTYDSIHINNLKENLGMDLPEKPENWTPRQYSDLFGGKGCLEPGCGNEKASKTYWSWGKRWCIACWTKKKIREDYIYKDHQQRYTRTTIQKMLESIPAGMQDSFEKPHDHIVVANNTQRTSPRVYKCYLRSDVEAIMKEYDDLSPPPYREDPNATAAEKTAAFAAHQALLAALDEKRNTFFTERKKQNDDNMERVEKIEMAVRERRATIRKGNDQERNGRKALFTKRCKEDLPWITEEFLKKSNPYKRATRVFRDSGSERGWRLLRPKLEKEWNTAFPMRKQYFPINGVPREPSPVAMDMGETNIESDAEDQESGSHTQHQDSSASNLSNSVICQQPQTMQSQIQQTLGEQMRVHLGATQLLHFQQNQRMDQTRAQIQQSYGYQSQQGSRLGSLPATSLAQYSSSTNYGGRAFASASPFPGMAGQNSSMTSHGSLSIASFGNPNGRTMNHYAGDSFAATSGSYPSMSTSSSSTNSINSSGFNRQSFPAIPVNSLLSAAPPSGSTPQYSYMPH